MQEYPHSIGVRLSTDQPLAPVVGVIDVEFVVVGEREDEVELVDGNTFKAMMFPSFKPSYMSPPYPGHISKPGIIGLK